MDFFHGLDNNRYGSFKASMMNGWASKSIDTPDTVNLIYRLAGSWVKTNSMRTENRTAASFMTTLDNTSKPNTTKGKGSKKVDDKAKKKNEEKDLSRITCFVCGVKGHYASQCPKRAQILNGNAEEEAGVNATWEAEQEATMYVSIKEHIVHNAVGPETILARKEVLLDNQADISIMHPSMLYDVREIDSKIRVKGVGGFQMMVKEKGWLKVFLEVYASSETKANVLSFAEVEDKYPISYIPQSGFIVHLQDRDLNFRKK